MAGNHEIHGAQSQNNDADAKLERGWAIAINSQIGKPES